MVDWQIYKFSAIISPSPFSERKECFPECKIKEARRRLFRYFIAINIHSNVLLYSSANCLMSAAFPE